MNSASAATECNVLVVNNKFRRVCFAALLTVEDDTFWEPDIPPVHFGCLPRLQDSVSVVGYAFPFPF